MLIFAGVFERYPNHELIPTEGGCDWVPGVLRILDHQHNKLDPSHTGRSGFAGLSNKGEKDAPGSKRIHSAFGGMPVNPKRPSEYATSNAFEEGPPRIW
jgi:hypothetical protein